jgi:hypothetical protein
MTTKLVAENGPSIVVGPLIDTSEPGWCDRLARWMLEQHVQLCAKGGIDCKSCKEAAALGIEPPA